MIVLVWKKSIQSSLKQSSLPFSSYPPRPESGSDRRGWAAVNHRQKKMGYNAAQELYRRVQENMMKKREEGDE